MDKTTKRRRVEPNRLAFEKEDKRPIHCFYIRSTKTYRSFASNSSYMSLIEINKLRKLNEYPLTIQGQLFTGIYLGSNTISGSMALEKEIDRIIDSYKGDDGGLSDFIKTKFEDVDLDNDDASETDSVSSEEEEPAINRKRKSVSDSGKKPFCLNRSGRGRDYIMQEILLNSSILANSKLEVSNSEPDANCSSSNQENPVLLKEVIKKLDAMETKNERYFKYLSTRMRAIERKCEKEQPATSSFNDEEIDGVTCKFRLSEISMKNPNKFLRRYTELKYGKKCVETHVFDCDQGYRSERMAASADVVADLKGRLRQCFIIDGFNFGSVWAKARDSLNNHGRELKHKHKR